MDEKSKQLGFAIVEYLDSFNNSNAVSQDQKESLEVATQCIQDVFNIDTQDPDQQQLFSMKPVSLLQVFDVYLQTKANKKEQSIPSFNDMGSTNKKKKNKKPEPTVSNEDKARAEDLKAQGNRLVAEKKFELAIEKYTEAIALDPYNPIYLSNRAAAFSGDKQHTKAIEDALEAVNLDPNFSKAYSRLGHAYYATSQFEKAHDAYAKSVQLDPTNATTKQALAQTKAKLPAGYKSKDVASDEEASDSADTGNPVTSRGGDGGGGGMPDLGGGGLAGLLNNPDMMNAAAQMMQSNPALAAMAQQFMGGAGGGAGGGGTPDLAGLLNNPQLMNMAQQAMQNPDLMNMLGGAGRGGGQRGRGGRGGRGNRRG